MRNFLSNPLRLTITIILIVVVTHFALWAGRMYLPGFPGELCGKIQGIAFTPFFMEFFFVAFGFLVVFSINHYRQKWDGDELVYLEVVDDPNAVAVPQHSKSVIFPERENNPDTLETTLAAVEGALELNDLEHAKEILGNIPENLKKNSVYKDFIRNTKLNLS